MMGLKNFFRKYKAEGGEIPEPKGMVIRQENHRTWGNKIEWWRDPERDKRGHVTGQIVGWLWKIPAVDDLIVTPMVGGTHAIWKILKVDRQRDPRDMFFADVILVGWEDDEHWAHVDLSEDMGGGRSGRSGRSGDFV